MVSRGVKCPKHMATVSPTSWVLSPRASKCARLKHSPLSRYLSPNTKLVLVFIYFFFNPASPQQITALSKAKVMTQGNVVYVASTNSIWRLVPVSLATQVDQLVDEKEFEEAINLLDQVTDMNPRQRV